MQRVLIVLTAVNCGILWSQSLHLQRPGTAAVDVPALIRGHALEIVDERGKVRASISVLPEDSTHQWKGKPYPETVLLRLMSPDGRPNVKLGATKLGSALLIGGESDPTYIQVLAEGGESTVKLINEDRVERVIRP